MAHMLHSLQIVHTAPDTGVWPHRALNHLRRLRLQAPERAVLSILLNERLPLLQKGLFLRSGRFFGFRGVITSGLDISMVNVLL